MKVIYFYWCNKETFPQRGKNCLQYSWGWACGLKDLLHSCFLLETAIDFALSCKRLAIFDLTLVIFAESRKEKNFVPLQCPGKRKLKRNLGIFKNKPATSVLYLDILDQLNIFCIPIGPRQSSQASHHCWRWCSDLLLKKILPGGGLVNPLSTWLSYLKIRFWWITEKWLLFGIHSSNWYLPLARVTMTMSFLRSSSW